MQSSGSKINSDISIIFATPEWISEPDNVSRVQGLATEGKLSLLAINEAYVFGVWMVRL